MILGGDNRELDRDAPRSTLDDLFRRAGVRNPQGMALIDPPNREAFTDGVPQRFSYAEADRAISALAARLRQLGLPTDAVVAMQLPNTVESVITLLGVLRAGMIAVPLPLLWRKLDMVAALASVGARAIITSSRIGSTRHVEIAMQAAAELFPVRYVCSFGLDLPDGVVPLDDVFAADQRDFAQPSARPGNAATHVAIVTFNMAADGLAPVMRNHMELIAGGMAVFLEGAMTQDATILSTIPLGSFAGLAVSLLPWLLSGGTLSLHHGFDPETFAAQCRGHDAGVVVLPGPAVAPLAQAGHLDKLQSIFALWRSPERIATSGPWRGDAALLDVASFGEIGVLATRRGANGLSLPFRCDATTETVRTAIGTLALRGPMVPKQGLQSIGTVDAAGFVDTGTPCRFERDSQSVAVTSPPGGITAVGGYRFRQRDLDWQVAQADPAATIVALPDAALGQKLAGASPDRQAMIAQLQALGVNPLIPGAFRPRKAANAA